MRIGRLIMYATRIVQLTAAHSDYMLLAQTAACHKVGALNNFVPNEAANASLENTVLRSSLAANKAMPWRL